LSENQSLTLVGFLVLAVVLASVAGLSLYFGEIHGEKAFEEVFGASVAVFMEAVIAGGLIWLYQRGQVLREKKAKIAHDIREIRAEVREAALLMTAHRSGKTLGRAVAQANCDRGKNGGDQVFS
jgi:hypothetical protein